MIEKEKAYIITGPTSGIGRAAAFELAKHGNVILVGRDAGRLQKTRAAIEKRGGKAVSIVCDLGEMDQCSRAAREIVALDLRLCGLVNNVGIFLMRPRRNSVGCDLSYATNHLGPFTLTEALISHLPDGANVLFVASAVEDPLRKPAVAAGFRGGRYISAEACARGEWLAGGSTRPGYDAYATTKQCTLATALQLAHEHPRLSINAIEPGVTPATGLGRDAHPALILLLRVFSIMAPFVKHMSTPERAGRVIADIIINRSDRSGIYYDENGHDKAPSDLVQDRAFCERVVDETRALLSFAENAG